MSLIVDNVVDVKNTKNGLSNSRHSHQKLGRANVCFKPPHSARGSNGPDDEKTWRMKGRKSGLRGTVLDPNVQEVCLVSGRSRTG